MLGNFYTCQINKNTALDEKGKGFILRKTGSHSIQELIPSRYSWAREYKSRLHTSLLDGLFSNRDSLLTSARCATHFLDSVKVDERLSRLWRDLNPGLFDPSLSALPTELSHQSLHINDRKFSREMCFKSCKCVKMHLLLGLCLRLCSEKLLRELTALLQTP